MDRVSIEGRIESIRAEITKTNDALGEHVREQLMIMSNLEGQATSLEMLLADIPEESVEASV
jgi:hypothetical protein